MTAAKVQPRMVPCKLCGKDTPQGNEYCHACYWKTRWPNHILRSPELERRRKRSHLLKLLELEPYEPSAFFQGSRKDPYLTTLTSCSCKDFALGHGSYPCKHIFRLAEELGLFRSEQFDQGEDDYTMHLTPNHPNNRRNSLPQTLRGEDEELVERFVTLLYFITKGVKYGERLLDKARVALYETTTEDDRKKAEKVVEAAKKALEQRKKLKFPEKDDALLDRLEKLGFIETVPSKKETISRAVMLTETISPKKAKAILDAYRGVYPPRIHHAVAKEPFALLDRVASKGRREECILRGFDATETPAWAFHVPLCFNDALDIKLISRKWNCVEYTVWTQGANFSFKAGDVLYRDLENYLKGTSAICVESAMSASGTRPEGLDLGADVQSPKVSDLENDESDGATGKDYFAGSVTFRDCVTNDVKTVTQMEFVKMLVESKPCRAE